MERKTYCDYLRIVATFAVIVLHVSATNWYGTNVNEFAWKTFNIYMSIVRWGVPIFVMISGSLFLNKDISYGKIYSKYIFRLMFAFLFWSLFYALASEDTLKRGIGYGLKTHMGDIAKGYYHMWFILMIIGVYMCIPICKAIISNELVMKYYLFLSFIFAFLLPWLIQILKDFVIADSESMMKVIGVIIYNLDTIGIKMVLGYTFYFVLGYYLDRICLNKKARLVVYFFGGVGLIFTVAAQQVLAVRMKEPFQNYFGNFNVNVLAEAICIHTFFKYHSYKGSIVNSRAAFLSNYTFGAYLIHVFFIEKLSFMGLDTMSFAPLLSVPIISLLVFVMSMCVSAILHSIPIVKKYLV
ncbi:acyltransferase [Butyrivibrio proteoclasticus]|uniref:acyltransferase n=1 Tax=Butyrivibrio proteoclasticus TaxID=43305 RepID=UPI00047903E1|nr:acyltransferase family protein [Butyrivibrio proteoclasticus]